MIPIFALFTFFALPGVLALPAPLPAEQRTANTLARRGYYPDSVITNPEALKWYQDTSGGDNDNNPSQPATFAVSITTTDGTQHDHDNSYNPASGNGNTNGAITSDYQCFQADAYPTIDEWLPFNTLWTSASQAITDNNPGATAAPDGTPITTIVHDSILKVAADTHFDARLILALIMQESTGILASPCTGYSNSNCGILQGPPGSKPYDPSDPAASIEQMIRDGVQGHEGYWPNGGPGVAYWMGVYGQPWKAMRAYNTGSVPSEGDLRVTAGSGLASYVVDVANRLVGWDGVARAQC
ncbi:hypothetical protein GTA08_BOTSDO04760 [Botryosphaeria dothidea]|uniref:Transglycosylase SLT domain-containing protein n=1 Tax=Botryosphaeria dothidea TaxID=55169 RepID=A0A8H4N386_9PEZI|nr:hypothetical protein GTA08_BOTSDO04760 [Botryosphaeria dothidea]